MSEKSPHRKLDSTRTSVGYLADLRSSNASVAESGPSNKEFANTMFAAALNIRLGHIDNANALYKEIGRDDLISHPKPKRKIVRKVGYSDKETKETERSIEMGLERNIEILVGKIIRWLIGKEKWQNQVDPQGRDQIISMGAFDFSAEPEYIAISKVLPIEEFYNKVADMLGIFRVKREANDSLGEVEVSGLELAQYDDKILLMHNGMVSIISGEHFTRLPN